MERLNANHIATLRTLAPLLWAALVTWALEHGIDLTAELSRLTGIEPQLVGAVAPLAIAIALWALASVTSWRTLQRILLLVGVDEVNYRVDGQLVGPAGRSDVVEVAPGPEGDQDFVAASIDAVIARGIDDPAPLLVAARRLQDAAMFEPPAAGQPGNAI